MKRESIQPLAERAEFRPFKIITSTGTSFPTSPIPAAWPLGNPNFSIIFPSRIGRFKGQPAGRHQHAVRPHPAEIRRAAASAYAASPRRRASWKDSAFCESATSKGEGRRTFLVEGLQMGRRKVARDRFPAGRRKDGRISQQKLARSPVQHQSRRRLGFRSLCRIAPGLGAPLHPRIKEVRFALR